MLRLFSLAVMLPAAVAATQTIRRLEDASYYGQDGYFKFSKCLRVKIVEDNDDDGNAYFYNGAYRSQSLAYASFVKCEQGCDGTCDPTVAYVAQLDETLEDALQYSQGYCEACTNYCRRRRLEGEEEEGEAENAFTYSPNCNTCATECAYLNAGGNGNDETAYLECQYAYSDDQGLDYYSAPTCANDGSLVMGLFYDDECTIKKSDDDSGYSEQFAYNSFRTMQSVCMNCADGVCEEMFNDATSCVDGKTADGGQDNMGVCKSYKRLSKEWQYAKAKKKSPLPVILLAFVLVGLLCFLSYSYYVRHKNANLASTKTALLEAESSANNNSDNYESQQGHQQG